MQIHSAGIDLGKTTFHLVALGAAGKVLVRKKFTQKRRFPGRLPSRVRYLAKRAVPREVSFRNS